MSNNTFNINRGSAFAVTFSLPAEAVGAATLTGFVAEIYDPHPQLAGRITVAISNAATREITLAAPWHEDYPDGRVMGFQFALHPVGGDPIASNRLFLNILAE